MPLFLISLVSSGETKGASTQSDRGSPVCLVECQQVVREPVIAQDANKDSGLFRNRKKVKTTQLAMQADSEAPIDEDDTDSKMLLTEPHLTSVEMATPSEGEHWTMELLFNLGFDRFFVVGPPCKLMIVGALRLHKPCLDVFYGLNMLRVSESSMIFVNDGVVDVHTKVELFDRIYDRCQLVFGFFGELPQSDTSGGDGCAGDSSCVTYPDHIIYFTMMMRVRPVALYSGPVQPSPKEVFKPLPVEIYSKKKFGDPVKSELKMMAVMSDSKRKDRKFILNQLASSTILVEEEAQCHVCSINGAFFSFSKSSIKIGGQLVVHPHKGPNQVVESHATLVVKKGSALLYLDDFFAILSVNEGTEYQMQESQNKKKDMQALSLVNTKAGRTGSHGYVPAIKKN